MNNLAVLHIFLSFACRCSARRSPSNAKSPFSSSRNSPSLSPMATAESFTDKNAVFRKLKAKSENKVCLSWSRFYMIWFDYEWI